MSPTAIADVFVLNQYGKIDSLCKVITLKHDEYITAFSFYYTPALLTGVGFVTNKDPVNKRLGSMSSKSFQMAFDASSFFMGFFGTSTEHGINSLGGIRMQVDCPTF
jgi:hypothetical protein